MALNTWERNTIAEIKARALAGQPVSQREKQLVLDLYARERVPVNIIALKRAEEQGLDISYNIAEYNA